MVVLPWLAQSYMMHMGLILSQQEALNFKPTLVYLNEHNHIVRTGRDIPVQVA